MELITSVAAMRAWAQAQRAAGRRLGLVPTMGYLHAGHLSLVAEARCRTQRTVMSLFVNPTQFGVNEDLSRYPRDLPRDQALAAEAGTDVLFAPAVTEMYPDGFQTHVEVEQMARGLCGASRPTHFRGVTTVVAKLFNITLPHVAVFGQKDYQQLQVIRRLVRDLDFDVEIVGAPTVREADGLAMSSRNAYLSPGERRAARCIPAALEAGRTLVASGTSDPLRIVAGVRQVLSQQSAVRIDYVAVVDAETLEEIAALLQPALLAVAARIGTTRLIDNCVLTPPPGAGAHASDAAPGC
jgi:pantoate--beta-alanine ligase